MRRYLYGLTCSKVSSGYRLRKEHMNMCVPFFHFYPIHCYFALTLEPIPIDAIFLGSLIICCMCMCALLYHYFDIC